MQKIMKYKETIKNQKQQMHQTPSNFFITQWLSKKERSQ